MKKTIKADLPFPFSGVSDPDLLFDLVCAQNWFAGNLDQKIPVEKSREVFRGIKELLTAPKRKKKVSKPLSH